MTKSAVVLGSNAQINQILLDAGYQVLTQDQLATIGEQIRNGMSMPEGELLDTSRVAAYFRDVHVLGEGEAHPLDFWNSTCQQAWYELLRRIEGYPDNVDFGEIGIGALRHAQPVVAWPLVQQVRIWVGNYGTPGGPDAMLTALRFVPNALTCKAGESAVADLYGDWSDGSTEPFKYGTFEITGLTAEQGTVEMVAASEGVNQHIRVVPTTAGSYNLTVGVTYGYDLYEVELPLTVEAVEPPPPVEGEGAGDNTEPKATSQEGSEPPVSEGGDADTNSESNTDAPTGDEPPAAPTQPVATKTAAKKKK